MVVQPGVDFEIFCFSPSTEYDLGIFMILSDISLGFRWVFCSLRGRVSRCCQTVVRNSQNEPSPDCYTCQESETEDRSSEEEICSTYRPKKDREWKLRVNEGNKEGDS